MVTGHPSSDAGNRVGGATRITPAPRALNAATSDRLHALRRDALVMHPGPMNRGVEIDAEAAEDARSVITAQVSNGVAVRMAVLYLLLGAGADLVAAGE